MSLKGVPKSEETRQRMREAQARRPPEQNERIAASLRGRTLSQDHIQAQRLTKMATGVWKPIGHRYVRRGYAWVKVAEGCGHDNYKAEHRYVVEQAIGRVLSSDEHVHHIDGDTLNNRLENLYVLSKKDHSLMTALARVVDVHLAKAIVLSLAARFGWLVDFGGEGKP